MKLPEADFECLSAAMNTWLAIGQINGDPEKKSRGYLKSSLSSVQAQTNCEDLDNIPA
jgi:hypothetical protein